MEWIIGFLSNFLGESPLLVRVFIIGLIPAAMTALGSIPVLLGASLSEKVRDTGMGFAAGVMTVASFTSLLLPAVELGGLPASIAGLLVGAGLIKALDALLPHMHWVKGFEGLRHPFEKELLVALAVVVHNIPEGMAVGVAATRSSTEGLVLAFAIGLQDVPEGLAVALPLVASRGKWIAFSIGVASGVAEAVSAFLPPMVIEHMELALPFMMALAAGAMVYVVVHEVVPEIYGHEHDEQSTIGFFAGFVTMLLLDTALS